MIYRSSKSYDHHSQDLLKILNELDLSLKPPLSERVNLRDFVKKIKEKGVIESAYSEDGKEIVGMIAYYNNDQKTKRAYMTFLGVRPNFQGKGIAKKLVDICLENCIRSNMESVEAEIGEENKKAFNLFRSRKFEIKEVKKNRYKKGVNNILIRKNLVPKKKKLRRP